MKIFLGSKSKDKKRFLVDSLNHFKLNDYSIKTYSVDSKVSKQPLTEKITLEGARNRAIDSLNKSKLKGIGIGLEGGLVKLSKNSFYLICYAVIIDSLGNEYIGASSKLALPLEISNKIKKGESFGDVIRHLSYNKNKINSFYIKQLISREIFFKQAISNAFLDYFFKNK